MKKANRKFRALRVVLLIAMMMQSVVSTIAAVAENKTLEQSLANSDVFSRADLREKAALSAEWASYFETFAGEVEGLKQHLSFEQNLVETMQKQLAVWGELRSSLKVSDDSLKRANALDALSKSLSEALAKRQSAVKVLQRQVAEIYTDVANLKQGKLANPEVFVRVFQLNMNAQSLENEREFSGRLWNIFVLGQVELVARLNIGEKDREPFVSMNKPLAELLSNEPGRLEKWAKGMTALQTAMNHSMKGIDADREAVLLKAALKLADTTADGLRTRSDANAKAHYEMAKRFKSVIERRAEQLGEVTQKSMTGIPQETFLLIPDASRLTGDWGGYAARYAQIGRELVTGLAEADKTFQVTRKESAQCIELAQQIIGRITSETVPAPGVVTFDALKKGLTEKEKTLASYSESLKKLDTERRKLLDQVQVGGKLAFFQPDLRNRTEATAYENLGKTYELAKILTIEVRTQVGAVLTLTEAAQSIGAAVSAEELKKQITLYDKNLHDWSDWADKNQTTLEQFRKLCIDITARYSGQTAEFTGQFKQALAANPNGQYANVLRQMLAKLERGSETITAFSQPILEAVKGTAPRLQASSMSWIGTSTVGGALTRMIERGAYFQGVGVGQVKALSKDDAKDFSNTLNITDLALAIDYPVRTFVTLEGMSLVIGLDGPGVVIKGIGNVDKYKLNPGNPQASVVPDFTLNGVAVGGWCDGVGQFFNEIGNATGAAMNATGQAIGSAVNATGQAISGVAQNVQQFSAKVVDDVGAGLNWTGQKAVEVGGFLYDSGGTMIHNIAKDPVKVATFAAYGAIGAACIVGEAATGGLATPVLGPLLLGTTQMAAKDIAVAYAEAMVETATEKNVLDKKVGDVITLGIKGVDIVIDAKGLIKNIANVPKLIKGVPKMFVGTTPRWTVGLPTMLRDFAIGGELAWKDARAIHYLYTMYKSGKAFTDLTDVVDSVKEVYSDFRKPSDQPSLPPASNVPLLSGAGSTAPGGGVTGDGGGGQSMSITTPPLLTGQGSTAPVGQTGTAAGDSNMNQDSSYDRNPAFSELSR